ncbi:MAG: hypothetical protein JNK85_25820 [Verrucomicrobiales bacterium]|nr:hypothetical protein [Verrucomicrobiales bacterium]
MVFSKPFSSFAHAPLCPRRLPAGVVGLVALLASGLTLTAAVLPPGAGACVSNSIPAGYGSFLLTKSALFEQSTSGTPAEVPSGSAAVIELRSPNAYAISNAQVAGPGNFRAGLTAATDGSSQWTSNYATETVLNATLLPGAWTTSFQLTFTNGDAGVGFFPLVLVSNVPPLPTIANLAAAQSINPSANFNLAWTAWAAATTNDRISLQVVDSSGTTVASAASDCSGAIPLASTAGSVDIPAGALASGRSYTGYLTFGASLFESTDISSLLVERVFQSRTTRFSLRTSGSSGGGDLGTIEQPVVSGTNLVFTLKGTPGATYAIESTVDLTSWSKETEVILPASGSLEVRLPLVSGAGPKFYRAVKQGGGGQPGIAPTLSLASAGPGLVSLGIVGTPGATYTVESTTNYQSWLAVTNLTLPTGSSNAVVTISIPAGTAFLAFRASSSGTVNPPIGKTPTLALTPLSSTQLRLSVSGGDANATYTIQSVTAGDTSGPNWSTGWTDQALTVTTSADGTGATNLSVSANASERGVFYRLIRR